MKKLLLFIGSVAFAMSVSAGSYTPTEKGDVKAGTTITSVDGVVLTFGGENDALYSLQGVGDKDFTTDTLVYNGVTYYGYFNGANNPKIDNSTSPSATAGMPNTGTYFKFDITKNGSLDICYVLNSGKSFYIYEVSSTAITAVSGFDGMTVTEKVYQGSTFSVTAGCTYYVYCAGSKLGFFGFSFTSSSEAKTLNSSDATVVGTEYYSITGARLSTPIKGLNIVKKIMSDGRIVTNKIIY